MADATHDRVKELTQQLETGIQDLYASARYGEYLAMLSKFHKYSYGNVMLIMMQCPHASMVAGFQTWKKASAFWPPAPFAASWKHRQIPQKKPRTFISPISRLSLYLISARQRGKNCPHRSSRI